MACVAGATISFHRANQANVLVLEDPSQRLEQSRQRTVVPDQVLRRDRAFDQRRTTNLGYRVQRTDILPVLKFMHGSGELPHLRVLSGQDPIATLLT